MSARKTNPIKTQKAKPETKTDRDNIMSNAHRIVSSAVNVLEEEIAAGILAAKNLESKLINVEEIRSNQDELINRIRRDTHEALDLFLDAFAALTQQLNGIIERSKPEAVNSKNSEQKKSSPNSETIILEAEKPFKIGEIAKFELQFSDEENSTKFHFIKSDLTAFNNVKISSRNINITPVMFSLKTKQIAEVTIQIKIPKMATSGFYHTLITDKYNPKIKIIVSLQVE
jgi:HPt (histidine-containing phosphotransfer) domain-containing protein